MGKAKSLAITLRSVCANMRTCGFCSCYEMCRKYKVLPSKDKCASHYSIEELTQKIKKYDKNE